MRPIPPLCQSGHSRKIDGRWQRGADETPGLVICANGVQQVKMQCNRCGYKSSPVPYPVVHAWGITREDIGWTKTHEPHTYPPCVVDGCEGTPTEMHHFAPRNTFGTDADLWPVLPLCKPHHSEWHGRMDGYRRHRKAAA